MALTANANPMPRPDPAFPVIERIYKAAAADDFYRGAVLCATAGKANSAGANDDQVIGFCTRRSIATAANDPVYIAITGVWWVAAAGMADADLGTTAHPLVTSDNPADIIAQGAASGDPRALGTIVHVDVTATSGWVDINNRVAATNS